MANDGATGKQKAAIGGTVVAAVVAATGAYTALHGTHSTTTAENRTPVVVNRPHDVNGSPLPVTVSQLPNGAPLVIVGHGAPGSCTRRKAANGQPLPDPSCTPGATRKVSVTAVCTPGTAADARSVTKSARDDVLAEYGDSAPYAGEIDHLISLQLGGANDEKNLWPEPGSIPNAKDTVENALHRWVCAPHDAATRTARLKAAQHAVSSDWTLALKTVGAQ